MWKPDGYNTWKTKLQNSSSHVWHEIVVVCYSYVYNMLITQVWMKWQNAGRSRFWERKMRVVQNWALNILCESKERHIAIRKEYKPVGAHLQKEREKTTVIGTGGSKGQHDGSTNKIRFPEQCIMNMTCITTSIWLHNKKMQPFKSKLTIWHHGARNNEACTHGNLCAVKSSKIHLFLSHFECMCESTLTHTYTPLMPAKWTSAMAKNILLYFTWQQEP